MLDIDNKNGKNGNASLNELQAKYGPLPDTLTVRTPSGGFHHFYKGLVGYSYSTKLGSGIDCPVMVPAPGSYIAQKGEYAIEKLLPIAEAPEWLIKLLGEAKIKRVGKEKRTDRENRIDRANPIIEENQPARVKEAIRVALNTAPAIEGENGDNATFQLACRLRDFALTKDVVLDIMLRYWNDRCSPPWSPEELSVKVDNAFNYAQSAPGERLASADFSEVTEDVIGAADDLISAGYKVAEFEAFEGAAPERKWLVRGWIPLGETTLLYGHGGYGKSLLALQLAVCASMSDATWLGLPIETAVPTVYVSCEDTLEEMHRRIDSMRNNAAFDFLSTNPKLTVISTVGNDASLAHSDRNKLTPGKLYLPLMKYLETIPGPKLLVIDTLADTFAGNENDRSAVNAFIKMVLGSMIVKRECTVLLIGHPAKHNESEYSGSTAWNNAARTRLTLGAHPNDNLTDHRVLTRSKSNYAKIGEQIELYYNSGVYEPVQSGEIEDTITEKNKEIIFDEIAKQAETGKPYGMFNASVPNILNFEFMGSNGKKITRQELKRLIDLLILEGRVTNVKRRKHGGNGLYPTSTMSDGLSSEKM